MKALRAIVLVLIVLVALFLLVSAFAPGKYEVSRSVSIGEPVDKVFMYAADLNNYDTWNPWMQLDKDAMSRVEGSGHDLGSKYSWNGDTIGEGYLVITELVGNSKAASDIFFNAPTRMRSESVLLFEPSGEATTVTWTMRGRWMFPFERFIMMFHRMEDSIGQDFEDGLGRLKGQLEEQEQ